MEEFQDEIKKQKDINAKIIKENKKPKRRLIVQGQKIRKIRKRKLIIHGVKDAKEESDMQTKEKIIVCDKDKSNRDKQIQGTRKLHRAIFPDRQPIIQKEVKWIAVNGVVKPINMDSDEYLTDDWKRKKDDVDELFKRSKRTIRTPTKEQESKDQGEKQMQELMSLMKNMAQDIKEIKIEQRKSNEETKKLQEEIGCLREDQREFKDEIKELGEGEKRRKNIVIQGLRGSSTNPRILKEEMEGFI
ncbi:hypothetical protein FQR65_LT19087 [Abscondita terminalis]|nr:hypothetical protein FQR65_LT19087 [Abscondita terminalis]